MVNHPLISYIVASIQESSMPRIRSQLKRDTAFRENFAHNKQLLLDLQTKRDAIALRDDHPSVIRHRSRGKLYVRDRIELLLDSDSRFLEVGTFAGYGMYDSSPASAGIVTGIGTVSGRQCMIVANDATVKGGSYYPITVKKHLRAQEIARENCLPCIYLVDSGGAFLPLQSEVFPDRDHFGRIFYNQAQMSAQGIPQLAMVMGSCTAGGAYVPAMSDETVIVKEQGTIFLAGPPLVKAATGEVVTSEDLGGGEVHCRISGVSDHLANNDEHAIEIMREIVAHLNVPGNGYPLERITPRDPFYDPEEILGIIPKDSRVPYDVKEVIARLIDGSEFHEFKSEYGKTLVCGFAHLEGFPVGILANNGVLFSESALKGAHFIELCSQRGIPLLFLQNITGFMVGKKYEQEGIAKHGAKMVMAVSNAAVPRFTVVIGGSFGAGNYGMCGRAYQPRQLWMWPNSKISVMGGSQASDVLVQVKVAQMKKKGQTPDESQLEAIRQEIMESYEAESNAYYSSAHLWDDGVINPLSTRSSLAMGIASSLNSNPVDRKQGVFRM